MCVALPGKVTEVTGTRAKVDFDGNLVEVNLGLVDAAPGQYVLVHAGCAIQVMEAEAAEEIRRIYEELRQVAGEDHGTR